MLSAREIKPPLFGLHFLHVVSLVLLLFIMHILYCITSDLQNDMEFLTQIRLNVNLNLDLDNTQTREHVTTRREPGVHRINWK